MRRLSLTSLRATRRILFASRAPSGCICRRTHSMNSGLSLLRLSARSPSPSHGDTNPAHYSTPFRSPCHTQPILSASWSSYVIKRKGRRLRKNERRRRRWHRIQKPSADASLDLSSLESESWLQAAFGHCEALRKGAALHCCFTFFPPGTVCIKKTCCVSTSPSFVP